MKPSQINVTPTAGRPARPSFLKGEAKKEWDRVCDELDLMGTLTTCDRPMLALYCIAWARWVEVERVLADKDLVIGDGVKQTPNAYLKISSQAHEQIVRVAKELGITPRFRSIIAKNLASRPGGETEAVDLELD